MTSPEKEHRILVLCVDRDNDLGFKAQLKTPIIGNEDNMKAAIALALSDPEEPDANAMFEAIRIYRRLMQERKPNEFFEIATVAGSELGGVGADRKIVNELNEVLSKFKASEVILVTDGVSDEAVLPLIESRAPVSSVRRIVIKHSESIEETAALFSRYLKTLVENPKYSRLVLGLPGILLIILGIFFVLNLLLYYWIAFLLVLGTVFCIKGFGIDRAAKNFYQWIKEYSPPPIQVQIAEYAAIIGFITIAVGFYLGWSNASPNFPASGELGLWLSELPKLVGFFIEGSIALIIIGICVVLAGRAFRWYFENDIRVLRTAVFIVVIAWSWQIFLQVSRILKNPLNYNWTDMFLIIITGILLSIAAVLVTVIINYKYADFFSRKGEEVEESKEN